MFARRVSLAVALALVLALPSIYAQADRTTSPVSRIADGTFVEGAWSSLVRNDAGVTMTFHTSTLEPGAAYTVWWVVFNHPEFCSAPCNANDFGNAAVQASRAFAAGHVIGSDGRANFGGHLEVGDASGFLDGPWGLTNPRGAEIHLVARTHGQPLTGELLQAQTSTFNGGCEPGQPYPPATCANRGFDPPGRALTTIR